MRRSIEIVEVSARDGLQNENVLLTTPQKIELIARAVRAGVRRIEVASFINPRRVPQMADAEAVCAGLPSWPDVVTIGLVLNRRGAERALLTQVGELGAVVSASDGFGIANQGRSSDQTLDDAIEIIEIARSAGRRAQATISVAFGCPFDGEISPDRVGEIARRLATAGPVEIALGDTIGVAAPDDVVRVLTAVKRAAPGMPIRCHFHDTRSAAVANGWAALSHGAATLDASIGGIGGCPFAPGASGNVATENLLYALDRSGISTGLDLTAIMDTTEWLAGVLQRPLPRAQRFPPVPRQ